MSNQTVVANVGNASMMKSYTDSATDGTFAANIMLDSISSQPLGILQPSSRIDRVNVLYTAGLCAWRIQRTDSLMVSRHGWASKTPYNQPNEGFMAPMIVNPKDTLQVYPMAVNATAGDTACLAWITANGKSELFTVTTSADNTAAELLQTETGQSIGDTFFGSTISHVEVQCEDGASLVSLEVIDNTGGVIYTQRGGIRGAYVGAMNLVTNIDCQRLSIACGKGFSIKVKTVTA
jgi:hypothetical protein